MLITLVRHTRVALPSGTCYGFSDVPLADTFAEEAAAVAEKLKVMNAFDAVYTSPLSRCVQLAEFCGFHDAQQDARLMEMNMGNWEMLRYDDIHDPRLQQWYADYLHVATTGGESFQDLHRRIGSFLNELRTLPHRHVLVFTHGGVIVSAMLHASLCKADNAFSLQPPCGGMVHMEW